MSAPESTAVIPPAPPAPAHATPEQVSALHRRVDELERWVGEKFHELLHLVERAVPVLSAAGGPVVAVVEKVAGAVACCAHLDRQHNEDGSCAVCSSCKGLAKSP